MDIPAIKKYWAASKEKLCTYKPSQLNNPRLLKATCDFLIKCGLPDSCAPCFSFAHYGDKTMLTPNEVFNININKLNDYLMIGSNGSGDPICIDLKRNNEIVYLNHDNNFERVYMNGSVHQLTACIIRYKDFHASLNPRFKKNVFTIRKFSDEEFSKLCNDFKAIDAKSLRKNNCWKAELGNLVWERDNG